MEQVQIAWHLGDVVRKLRQERRWTQKKLAKLAGMNKSTVVQVESNSGIKRDTMEKIAVAFELSMGELFSLIPSQSKGAQGTSPGESFPSTEWDGVERRRSGRAAEHR